MPQHYLLSCPGSADSILALSCKVWCSFFGIRALIHFGFDCGVVYVASLDKYASWVTWRCLCGKSCLIFSPDSCPKSAAFFSGPCQLCASCFECPEPISHDGRSSTYIQASMPGKFFASSDKKRWRLVKFSLPNDTLTQRDLVSVSIFQTL